MKRNFIKTLLIILIFLFCYSVKALDEREVLTSVVATSNTSSIPAYGANMVVPTFNVTSGTEARFDTTEARWYWYNGSKWIAKADGYKFNSGSWHYRVKVIIDGEEGSLIRLGNQTTINVDGVDWTFSYCSTCSDLTSSYGWAISPNYVLEGTGELYYFEEEYFRVYTNYVGVGIASFSVADTVEGGTAPYTFSKTSGPEWVNVSSTGMISGTPVSIGENESLIVRVTDANDDYKEITVPVDKTILPPAQREPIETIEATSNINSIPVIGADIVVPTFNMVTTEGSHFAGYAGGWYKLIGSKWQLQTGKFTAGKWKYSTQVILEDENAEMQRLTDDTVVIVDGVEWESSLSGYANEYYTLSVDSPEYTLVDKINSITLEANIKAPKVGENITEPIIWVSSMNGDNSLINYVDIEANWQYKTGDGFFDWIDASGKFESDKTYHIRLLLTINTEIYELSNIATFPVTLEGYNLTQFQLNDKTVGEFIEFDALDSIVVPTVSISSSNSKITLSWDNQKAATKYLIYRSNDGKKYKKVKEVTTNSYSESGLTYGKKYYYKVRSCDAVSCTNYSNVVYKKIVPNKVTLSIKSASTNNVKLMWEKVGTTGYQIYRSTDNKRWTRIKTITKNSTLEFNVKKLKANKTYYFKVRAYKTVRGRKVYGSFSNVVKIKTAPVKPKFSVSYKDYNALNLNIGGVSGVSTYYVYQSLDGKTYTYLIDLPAKGVLAQEDLEIGKIYYYAVKACNSYNACSGWVFANRKVATKTPTFTLSTTSKKVTIKLSSVNMADGYEVYRSTSRKGKYTLVKAFTSEEELLFNNTTKKGYTYYYKVVSYIMVNDKKVYSSWSSIKSIRSK